MKGMFFTEFLEMVEDKFGFDVTDDIIEASKNELYARGMIAIYAKFVRPGLGLKLLYCWK